MNSCLILSLSTPSSLLAMSLKKSTNGTQQDKLREKHAKSVKPTRKSTLSKAAEFLIKHQIGMLYVFEFGLREHQLILDRPITKHVSLFFPLKQYSCNSYALLPLELPLAVISTIGMAYLCGVQQAEKFLFIKYRDPETGLYAKGKDDIYFVSFWVIMFTFLRAAVMEHLLIPIAKKEGIKTTTRFAEQGWLFIYYSTSWTLGMVSENTDVEKERANRELEEGVLDGMEN